ncbi:hypothetical protein ACOMHN_060173 [Nucella lapillus]
MTAQEIVTLTQTSLGTGHVTHQFIVLLRTLAPAITQMNPVNTDFGPFTLIEVKTCQCLTALLIFAIETVRKSIASRVDREAVEPPLCTQIMAVRTEVFSSHQFLSEETRPIQSDIMLFICVFS